MLAWNDFKKINGRKLQEIRKNLRDYLGISNFMEMGKDLDS
jgi:hypothetical protein